MSRKPYLVFERLPLGQTTELVDCTPVPVGMGGHLDLSVDIANAAGAAPSDAPVGTWQLWTSTGFKSDDDANYKPIELAQLTQALTALNPTGNNAVVSKTLTMRGVPGKWVKVRYIRSTGGSATIAASTAARARVSVTVDDA